MKDLHIHTVYSDGEHDEYEIVRRIIEAGIEEFAICDHDIIEGSKRVREVIENNNYDLIFHSGVELSLRINDLFNGVDIHVLYRDFDYDDPKLDELLRKIRENKKNKVSNMVKLVDEIFDVKITKEELEQALSKTKSFGKPHMYTLLTKHIDYDREEYFKKMKALKSERVDAVEAFNLLKDSKGYFTLAHPIEIMEDYHVGYDFVDEVVGYLAKYGLRGLETRHSKHTEENYKEFSRIAKKYDLVETCGSDYHGEHVKSSVKLGIYVKEERHR